MKHIHTYENFMSESADAKVNEGVEYIGPFVISDRLSDDELKQMHNNAVEGYANWQSGFYYKKADYRKAYETLEKIAKQRGINL